MIQDTKPKNGKELSDHHRMPHAHAGSASVG